MNRELSIALPFSNRAPFLDIAPVMVSLAANDELKVEPACTLSHTRHQLYPARQNSEAMGRHIFAISEVRRRQNALRLMVGERRFARLAASLSSVPLARVRKRTGDLCS